jgi:hypothetical protein
MYHASLPTDPLYQISPLISSSGIPESTLYIVADLFDKTSIRALASFLQGNECISLDWVSELSPVAAVDLAMLAAHFRIASLQFVLVQYLKTYLIDDGHWPNHPTLIHVWALSLPEDPIRRLMLASFFIHVVILEQPFHSAAPDQCWHEYDHEEGLWLASLKELLDGVWNYEMRKSYDDYLHDQLWKPEGNLYPLLSTLHDMAKAGHFDQSLILRFSENTLEKGLIPCLNDLVAEKLLPLYNEEPMFYPVPGEDNTEQDESDNDAENTQAGPASTLKRKHDAEHDDSFAEDDRAHKLPRVKDDEKTIMVFCKGGNKLDVNRVKLRSVSSFANNRLLSNPQAHSFDLDVVEVLHLKDFLAIDPEGDSMEKSIEQRSPAMLRTILTRTMTAEHLGSGDLESRLLNILQQMLKAKTMNVAIAQFVYEGTRDGKSRLRKLVAKTLHWVAYKAGWVTDNDFFRLCFDAGTGLTNLYADLQAINESWKKRKTAKELEIERAEELEKEKEKESEDAEKEVGEVEESEEETEKETEKNVESLDEDNGADVGVEIAGGSNEATQAEDGEGKAANKAM